MAGADAALKTINEHDILWDSQRVAKRALLERTKELGLEFKDGSFIKPDGKPEDKSAETATQEGQDNAVHHSNAA